MTMSANGGSPMGWYSVGTGTKMAGSNMMVSSASFQSSGVKCRPRMHALPLKVLMT